MLYEFHRKSSAKKPGSVHATYLISGRKHLQNEPRTNGSHSQNDGDKTMQSSPPLPSSSAPQPDENTAEPIVIRIIMLAKEEHLDQAKKQFEHISTIHVYSLQANGLSDVQALTECNRKIAVDYASEDPLKDWKQYGTIQNPNVQRRTTKMPPPPPVPVEKDPVAKTKPFATTAKAKEAETKAEVPQAAAEPERKGTPNPIQVKRQNSDIFKSFAKGKTKSKETSQSSKEASPAAPEPEDEPMGGFSDDDDTAMEALEEQQPLDADAPGGKSKKEREAELQAMMDQEDEAMEDATESAQQLEEPPAEVAKAEEEPAETATVENGRRRGKRRIMKKKKVKDEEGYLGIRYYASMYEDSTDK